jgi:hypothetical protein
VAVGCYFLKNTEGVAFLSFIDLSKIQFAPYLLQESIHLPLVCYKKAQINPLSVTKNTKNYPLSVTNQGIKSQKD